MAPRSSLAAGRCTHCSRSATTITATLAPRSADNVCSLHALLLLPLPLLLPRLPCPATPTTATPPSTKAQHALRRTSRSPLKKQDATVRLPLTAATALPDTPSPLPNPIDPWPAPLPTCCVCYDSRARLSLPPFADVDRTTPCPPPDWRHALRPRESVLRIVRACVCMCGVRAPKMLLRCLLAVTSTALLPRAAAGQPAAPRPLAVLGGCERKGGRRAQRSVLLWRRSLRPPVRGGEIGKQTKTNKGLVWVHARPLRPEPLGAAYAVWYARPSVVRVENGVLELVPQRESR